MTFQPFVPSDGVAGWRFLQSTLETQRKAHAESPSIKRDLTYFRENIGKIDTAEQLVSDYRLLSVALEAFGLTDDLGSKFLVRKVLEEGTTDPKALANRLSDKRYRDLSRAFGFGDFATPNTKLSDLPDRITSRFQEQRFETDLGKTNETMRLALNAERELPALANGPASNRTKWFTLMGTPPLRKVMETALGLPKSFATLPIDRQLDIFLDRSRARFGSDQLSKIVAPENLGPLLDRYTAIAGTAGNGVSNSVTSPALILLRGF